MVRTDDNDIVKGGSDKADKKVKNLFKFKK